MTSILVGQGLAGTIVSDALVGGAVYPLSHVGCYPIVGDDSPISVHTTSLDDIGPHLLIRYPPVPSRTRNTPWCISEVEIPQLPFTELRELAEEPLALRGVRVVRRSP